MKTKIDIDSWKRKDHYNHFITFDHPYLCVTGNVNCKKLYDHCKRNKISFFIAYIYISNLVTNEIEEFKLRIENNEVYQFDVIHASPTIAREDETFGFGYFETNNNFSEFNKTASAEIKRIKNMRNLELNSANDLIYYSVLPGLSFTQIQHPEIHSKSMSIPKIVFGKIDKSTANYLMPISVSVNHALVDGLHISKYFELFQQYILECEEIIKI